MSHGDDDQSTAHLPRFAQSPSPRVELVVVVENGPDASRSVRIRGSEPSELVVGQSPVCDLKLSDPSVSRRHVALDVVVDALRVRDLGSTNGTFIGGVRTIEAFARAGDAIVVGNTTLRVSTGESVRESLPLVDRFSSVVGASREMRRLFPLLERLAATAIPILIEGETGTGKEAVAEAIHARGPRAKCPFVVFDCTQVASSLAEAELFGHEKGAFTGATSMRRGVFEQAEGGTLLIDEIGELPLDLQAKLLRAIDTSKVRRIGSEKWVRADARIIAATRRDLDRMVTEGRFRDDLFHRLAVGRVALPPLRTRRGDIPLLIEHFCAAAGETVSKLPRNVIDGWCAHDWPGNVRELRNAVTRELALGDVARGIPAPSAPADVRAAFEAILAAHLTYDDARSRVLDLFQRRYLEAMLEANDGNVHRAAESAGIASRYFHLLRARHRK